MVMEASSPVWIYAAKITPDLIKIGRSKDPEKRLKSHAHYYSRWLDVPRDYAHLLCGFKMPSLGAATKAETLMINRLTSQKFDYIGREAYYCREEDCIAAMVDAAEDIMGQPVTRDQMFRWCGPRDGSKKPKEQSDG